MTTLVKQYFLTPEEFWVKCNDVVQTLSTAMFVRAWGQIDEAVKAVSSIDEAQAFLAKERGPRMYFSDANSGLLNLSERDLIPAKLRWVQIDVPCIVERSLSMCEIAARDDWLSSSESELMKAPTSLNLQRRIHQIFNRDLHGGLWCVNEKSKATKFYKNLRYSNGVAAWLSAGGKLSQYGVENLKFSITPGESIH